MLRQPLRPHLEGWVCGRLRSTRRAPSAQASTSQCAQHERTGRGPQKWRSTTSRRMPLSFDQAVLAHLISIAPNDREAQRLHRVSQPHAGAWVTAVPSDEDGFQTILRPKNFRTAAASRLGVVVLKGDIPCPMCTQTIDKL